MQWHKLFEHKIDYPLPTETPWPRGGGVYLLTDEQDRLILLASAANLGRALPHRLESAEQEQPTPSETSEADGLAETSPLLEISLPLEAGSSSTNLDAATGDATDTSRPSGRRKLNLGEITRHIYWQPANSGFEIAYEYHRIAQQIFPRNYRKHLGFGTCCFVAIDPTAAIPRLTLSREFRPDGGTNLGPFATHNDASRFVQALQDAFDLCRHEHILQLAPKGQACAYAEMGRCPAPCDGTTGMEVYRQQVAAALRYALGDRATIQQHWREQMQHAAAERAFERAAAFKQRIERAQQLEHDAFRHVRDVRNLSYLVIQRGSSRTRFMPFFVIGGIIHGSSEVTAKQLPQFLPIWREQLIQQAEAVLHGPTDGSSPEQAARITEHLWLLSHFLFKRQTPGLYRHWCDIPAESEAMQKWMDEL